MSHQIKFEILDSEDQSTLKIEDFSETEDFFESPKSENLDLESQNLSKSEKCPETIKKESTKSTKRSLERIKKESTTSMKRSLERIKKELTTSMKRSLEKIQNESTKSKKRSSLTKTKK